MTLSGNIKWFNTIFGLTPILITKQWFLWQFITSMFLHGDFFHLLFNMLGLFFFGPDLEWRWGKKTFLKFYFAIGILSALFQYVLNINSMIPSIGASGAVYGVIGAYAALYPDRQIILMIFPIKMKYFVLFLMIIPAFLGTIGAEGSPGIAHAVHISGVLLGIAYARANWDKLKNANAWVKEQIRLWKIRRKYKNLKVVDKDVKKMWDDLEEKINTKDNKKDYIN
jgi:membrane associated rhomboid family serine protease